MPTLQNGVAKISIGPLATQSTRWGPSARLRRISSIFSTKTPGKDSMCLTGPHRQNARDENMPAGPEAVRAPRALQTVRPGAALSPHTCSRRVRTDVPLKTLRLRNTAQQPHNNARRAWHHTARQRATVAKHKQETRAYSPIAAFAPRRQAGWAAASPPSPNRTSLTPKSAGRRASGDVSACRKDLGHCVSEGGTQTTQALVRTLVHSSIV